MNTQLDKGMEIGPTGHQISLPGKQDSDVRVFSPAESEVEERVWRDIVQQ